MNCSRMKFNIAFLLFSAVCFSQGKEFSTVQIDSIAQVNGSYTVMNKAINSKKNIIVQLKSAQGKVYEEKQREIEGKGNSSITTYLHYDLEKKMHEQEKDSELIKAVYYHNITYEDMSYDKITAQFYYRDMILFYIKISYITKEPDQSEKMKEFALKASELENPELIKSSLLLDLKPLLESTNKEILKHSKY